MLRVVVFCRFLFADCSSMCVSGCVVCCVLCVLCVVCVAWCVLCVMRCGVCVVLLSGVCCLLFVVRRLFLGVCYL